MEVHRGEDVRVCRLTPGVEEHLRNMGAPVSVVPPEKILFPWTKAAFIVPGPLAEENPQCGDILAWLEENCPGRYDAAPSGAIVDVACAGSTKGTGVLRLLEYLGAGREGLFCAGDGWNDLPMLRLAHRGVCAGDGFGGGAAGAGDYRYRVPPGAACGILWSFWRSCTEKRKQGRPDESIVRAALLLERGFSDAVTAASGIRRPGRHSAGASRRRTAGLPGAGGGPRRSGRKIGCYFSGCAGGSD